MKRAPNARWTRIFGLAGLLTLLRRVRRRADAKELAIESREQLFSMLVRNADDIYVMFSPDAYEVEYVSPNVEKLLGVSVEAVKNNIRALSDSAADPSSDPRIDDIASLEEGECLQVFRERIQARTGERRWYQETLLRLRNRKTDAAPNVVIKKVKPVPPAAHSKAVCMLAPIVFTRSCSSARRTESGKPTASRGAVSLYQSTVYDNNRSRRRCFPSAST